MNYLTQAGDTICANCANKYDDVDSTYQWEEPVIAFGHWEGPDMYCDRCKEAMPSGHCSPDDEENN